LAFTVDKTDLQARQRKIIHCDCDCFYAAVEMRDDPSLAALPLAVGGAADRRGVVATCNYPARAFGIRSAMPTAQAIRLCPSLVVLPPNFDKYIEISRQIKNIFYQFTDKVEPLSLDEAFLDVSDTSDFHGSATLIAESIRRRVFSEVGIKVSAGVAPNKFLAKIASDWNKPDGIFVVPPEQVDAFVERLPVGKLYGVGKVTEQKLNDLGVSTCGQLRSVGLVELTARFGVMGQRLFELCRGIDNREVKTDRRRKSLSVENTFVDNLPDVDACLDNLRELVERLTERHKKLTGVKVSTKQFLKLRFDDFTVTTIERSLENSISLSGYKQLLIEAWLRKGRPVRLLGIGVRFADPDIGEADTQYSLFD
jgi:DNA polymerase IV